jgi:crossover junction endodeoxyribonuclease RusA
MSEDYGTCNRDYFIQQYPDLADVFKPKTKAQQSFAQPTPRKSRPKPAPLPLRKPERAGDVLVLFLPLPPEELHPNARVHFQNKARHAKNARNIAATIATTARLEAPWEAARIDATFYLPRVRDADGLWTWIKNYIDGLQQIIIQNDSRVQLGDVWQHTGKLSDGRREVEITLTRLEQP